MAEDFPVVGKVGEVITRIRGGESPGEVCVTVRGVREQLIAYADEVIEPQTAVLIFRFRGARAVDVMPWGL
jgi:hypothetical protein